MVLGKNLLVYPARFTAAVSKAKSRTRIARKSSYVEVVAPLVSSIDADELSTFVFPTTLDRSNTPVTLNIPHLNLDVLPTLDLSDKKEISWLTGLAFQMFSPREKRIREDTGVRSSQGLGPNCRVNFKDSLFSIFMLSSGLQDGQTGLFTLHNSDKGGVQMLIFISALRLDGAHGSVVADAAVLPLTFDLLKHSKLKEFLALAQRFSICNLNVDDEEMTLWKKTVPALAERCRTWMHTEKCEYKEAGASIPLSLEHGKPVLCSCGIGKLPDQFIAMPEWEQAARYATRIAISPVYSFPFVEDVFHKNLLESSDALSAAALSTQVGQLESMKSIQTDGCRSCSAREARGGGALKKCRRCLEAKYCSAECQKKDWRKHKNECMESDVEK